MGWLDFKRLDSDAFADVAERFDSLVDNLMFDFLDPARSNEEEVLAQLRLNISHGGFGISRIYFNNGYLLTMRHVFMDM